MTTAVNDRSEHVDPEVVARAEALLGLPEEEFQMEIARAEAERTTTPVLPDGWYVIEHFHQESDSEDDATGCAVFGPYEVEAEAESDRDDGSFDGDTLEDVFMVEAAKLGQMIEWITHVPQPSGTEIVVNNPGMLHDEPLVSTTYLAP